jgi:MFS family permease
MIGSIIKSGGMPPIINAELKKGKGEWRVYLGFFLVGLSQPLYQCTPALLSASWFPERERTMATGVALNANQLGIGFAFIFGTLLVANSDDIPSYFGLLSIISTITFFGALLQFDDAPPTPPSDTARVIRGTLKVDIPSVTSILQSIGYRGQGGNPPPVNPPLNMAPDSTASKSKSKSKSRRSKEKKSRSAASSSSSGIARRRNPNPTPGGVPQPGTGASGFDSSYRGVGPSPSPARYGRVSERYPAPSPMLPGAVAGSTQSLDPSESGQDSEAPDPDAPELPYDQPGIYPSLYPTGMLPPGGYAMPPGLWYGPDGGGGGAPPQYPPYGYPYPGVPPGPPPQGMVPPGYPPPPYWDPRFQQYPPYAMKPFQQVQPGQHKQQLPYYYPPQGMPPQMMMNQYYSYQHGQPGHPDAYDIPRGPYSDAHAMLPPTSLIDEGAEPVLTISAHHLDINIRDDQVFLSTKACLSRPGFIHSLVSFTVSGIVINTLSTFMDYLVRLNGAGREMTGIVGGSFQFVIMCSSLIIGKLTDRSRAYYSVTIAMLVLGAFGLAQCGVSLNADKGNQLRVSLIIVAILVGPLQPVSTELGVEVAYPLSENTVLVIQQLFSNLLSALFIPCFKAMKNIGINKSDEAAEQPEYTFSFYLLIVLHAAASKCPCEGLSVSFFLVYGCQYLTFILLRFQCLAVWFATFNGRYLRYEHELIKKEQQENRRNQQQQQQQQAAWGQYEPANDTAPLIANEHPLV